MERKTPLYDCHVALGGKIVPFAGYLLPVQYPAGVIAEHMAVRTKCGLFDVSHMGEVVYEGPDALANINKILTNDYTKMDIGRVRYSLMCYENGGVVDKANAQEVVSDPTHLAYFNNEGTPVNVDYKMYISVEVAHKWGVLKKEALEVNVHKAAGTPNN